MRIHNLLPQFMDCMRRWDAPPSLEDFVEGYYRHLEPWVSGILFEDEPGQSGAEFHSVLAELNWPRYRKETLSLDPGRELDRARRCVESVEKLFGFALSGELILFGSLAVMDGYARFDRGTHRVFLGADESHAKGAYLDILITHELTHVARESRPEVWQGWGLNPKMTHDEFTESQPVIEHVFGEGFSCAVSEILVPGAPRWQYAYQSEESLASALTHGPCIDHRVALEIALPHAESDYTRLYDPDEYRVPVPSFSHYVWGWQWAKGLLAARAGGDPRKLVSICSREFQESAREFKLKG
jgi:hypothetical protein